MGGEERPDFGSLSNNTNSTSRETHREREIDRETEDREGEGEREDLPRGTTSGGPCSSPGHTMELPRL